MLVRNNGFVIVAVDPLTCDQRPIAPTADGIFGSLPTSDVLKVLHDKETSEPAFEAGGVLDAITLMSS